MAKVKLSKEEYLDYISNGRVQLSTEYNTFDWKRFLFSDLITLYRHFASNYIIKIDNPGLLISLFTGKWTTFGQLINSGHIVMKIVALFKEKSLRIDKAVIGNTPNMYKIMFVDYKKAGFTDISVLRDSFQHYKDIITYLKQTECRPIPTEDASGFQANDITLFKPDKIKSEIDTALRYYDSMGSSELNALAKEVAEWIDKNVVQYLIKNIVEV